jgi:putative hydrolase of the HAD superfamily
MQPESSLASRQLAPMQPIATGEMPRGLDRFRHIQAILFDVYGTLIISRAGETGVSADHGQQKSIQKLLRQFDIPKSSQKVSQLVQATIAREHDRLRTHGIDYPEVDILDIWQRILGWDDLPRLQTFAQKYESIINPVYPMPGLRELLRSCRDQGLSTGIISNAQFYTQGLLEDILAQSLDACWFDSQLIFYSYQYQRAKPSVQLFEMAARRLLDRGIQPDVSLYVGNDMRNDILPAQKVGFQTALFAGDQRSLRWRKQDPDCRDLIPDMVVTDLRQLILEKAGSKESRIQGFKGI